MNTFQVFKELKKKIPKNFFFQLENTIYNLLSSENKLNSFFYFKKIIKNKIYNLQDLKYLFLIGLILAKYKCYYQSLLIFFYCITKDKNNPDAYFNIGLCFKNLNKAKLAIIYFNKQEKFFGKNNKLTSELAKSHQIAGNIQVSEKYYLELLTHCNFLFEEHKEYSVIHKYSKDDPHLEMLINLEKNDSLEEKNKKFIFFALAKAFEDLKDYKKSFNYLKLANELRKKEVPYSSYLIKKQFLAIKNAYKSIILNNDLNIDKGNKIPIKIVGLPRSGTTLLEQIISSHSKVYSMAESLAFPSCIKQYFPSSDPDQFQNEIKNVNYRAVKKFRETYFKIQFNETSQNYITDKLPFNFIFVGLIHKFIPEAKIIHIKRNAKDTCISILKNYFIGKNITFAYSEEDLVDYYFQYEDLMKFWKNNCPDSFLEISYEDLINNFDISVKKILSFLNLDFEENIKSFYKNKSSVFSLSLAQVRSPIYKTSLNSWKNFEKYLSDSFKSLPWYYCKDRTML